MRATQYALVLVAQVLLLLGLFTFGSRYVDLTPDPVRTTNTSPVPGSPAGPGADGLLQQLSR